MEMDIYGLLGIASVFVIATFFAWLLIRIAKACLLANDDEEDGQPCPEAMSKNEKECQCDKALAISALNSVFKAIRLFTNRNACVTIDDPCVQVQKWTLLLFIRVDQDGFLFVFKDNEFYIDSAETMATFIATHTLTYYDRENDTHYTYNIIIDEEE